MLGDRLCLQHWRLNKRITFYDRLTHFSLFWHMSFEEDYWKFKIQRSIKINEPLPRMSTVAYRNWNNNIYTRKQEVFQKCLHLCPEMHITLNSGPFYTQLGYMIQTMFNFHMTSGLTEFIVFWYGLGLRETAWLIEKSTNFPRLVMLPASRQLSRSL